MRRVRAPRIRPLAFTAFAMITVIGAVVVAFYLVNVSAEDVFLERERHSGVSEREILKEVFNHEGRPAILIRMERRARLAPREAHYGLFTPDGQRIGGDLLTLPQTVPFERWDRVVSSTRAGPITLNATAALLSDGSILFVGRDAEGQRLFERQIADGLMIALGIVVVASLGVGLLLNTLVIQRARSVAEVAERIAAGDLGARADVSDRGDSFDRIGRSLNEMLDRIEELMTGMRSVTDSLAHDLRTPLTRMRAAIERALDPRSTQEDCRSALETADRELEQVLAVFTALLDIARAEAGLSSEMMQPVRLDALASDMAELFTPELEDAGQQFELGRLDPVTFDGHEPLLRQALGNLLFNAARHAGRGARVTLEVRDAGEGAEIVVADNGPGIPPEDRDRVRQRFVKLDGARRSSGSGLGLSIAAAAAKLHGGELLLEDNHPGLRVVLRLRRGRTQASIA